MIKKLSLIVAAVLAVSLVTNAAKNKKDVGGTEWKARMQSMMGDVLKLFPYAFDDAKFRDPKNTATIKKSLMSLKEKSADLKNHTTHMPNEEGLKIDPSFPFIANAFESELAMAELDFNKGEKFYTQSENYLRSAISKCVTCHTQTSNGPELKVSSFQNQMKELSLADKMVALTATRQFDEALNAFDQYVKDAKVTKPDNFIFDRQTRGALAIAIRVKKDPKRTMDLINNVAQSEAGSTVLKSDIEDWRKAVTAWQNEKAPSLDTDQAIFNEANRLYEDGVKKQTATGVIESPTISFLRASAYLHDLLSNHPKSTLRAKSYLLLASIYELLPGFAIWDLSDEYLGACIQENPHSEMGEKCFAKYEDVITSGYTGSSGTHIPWTIRQHLERMRELAKQKKRF